MLIPRRLTEYLKELTNYFPAISLTGPRQAGKTTLLKQLYSDYTYLSLEDIELRAEAEAEPRDFLKKYNDKIIFDEAQRFPQLFSYLQQVIDDDRRNTGRFILSGSQNFLLRKNITQSLAGRVGIAKLMPLDNHELKQVDLLPDNFELACLLGGYPGKIDMGLKGRSFYRSYLSSYIERDVAELISVSNLTVFQRFLRVCATMAGRIINVDKLSRQVGVSPSSISSWLGILEQSYIIFRLPPFFRNLGKRLTKTPKLYFYDTGLLCYLLNLYDVEDIQRSGFKGEIFENFIIADAFKSLHHQGVEPHFYFYRDKSQAEVDLIYERGNLARLWEIKATHTFRPRLIESLEKQAAIWDRPTETTLIYTGDDEHLVRKTHLKSWYNQEWAI